MVHNDIVAVGVDAQVACHAHAVVHHIIENPMTGSRTCKAMHDIVGLIIQPLALVDFLVGRFRARDKSELGDHIPTLLYTHIAMAVIDIGLDGIAAGIAVYPLVHVTARAHNGTRLVNEPHNYRHIVHQSLSNHPFHAAKIEKSPELHNRP